MTKAKKKIKRRARKSKKPGPKTMLDSALALRIKGLLLKGLNYKEIRKKLKINEATWDGWINKGINELDTKLIKWKRERMIRASEKVLSEIIEMSPDVQAMGAFGPIFQKKKKGGKDIPIMKTDVGILKIQQDTAKYVTETLASDVFNKKVKVEHDVTDPLDKLLREISDTQ